MRTCFIIVLMAFALGFPHANAELAQGSGGEFKSKTQTASSSLHKALSLIELLSAAIDNNDEEKAGEFQGLAVTELDGAAGQYKDAGFVANNLAINPVPSDPEDISFVDYFYKHQAAFGIKEQLSERSLDNVTVDIVHNFSGYVSKIDIKRLFINVREHQRFVLHVIEIKLFLLSITTVFRVG